MTLSELYLPQKRYEYDSAAQLANDRALETWARENRAVLLGHGADHALDGTDPALSFPVFLGAVHIEKAATNTLVTPAHWADLPEYTTTVTKKLAATRLLVSWGFTGQPSASGSNWDIRVDADGLQSGVLHRLRNIHDSATRIPPWTGVDLISSVPAGSTVVKLQIGLASGSVNFTTYITDDFANFEIWEVPA
jgi:hypothetical protein